VSLVVRVAIELKKISDLPKLIEGLKRLSFCHLFHFGVLKSL
jgi:translation elongation factor EF-G